MGRLVATVVLGLACGSGLAQAGGPVDDAVVARQLASPDPQVRAPALVDVILGTDAEADAVLARVPADGPGAASVARVRAALALKSRMAGASRDTVAFWRLLETALSPEWRDLEPAIVLAATREGPAGRASLLAKRAEALGTAARFCAHGAEFVPPAGDPTVAELDAQGARAVPHLLHVLAYDPWSSFWGIGGGAFALHPPGALEQGGAIRALQRLHAREAVPYLLFHVHGPSYTVEGAAAWALKTLTGVDVPRGKDGFDATAVFAWWEKERAARAAEVFDFVEEALSALLESLPFLELMLTPPRTTRSTTSRWPPPTRRSSGSPVARSTRCPRAASSSVSPGSARPSPRGAGTRRRRSERVPATGVSPAVERRELRRATSSRPCRCGRACSCRRRRGPPWRRPRRPSRPP